MEIKTKNTQQQTTLWPYILPLPLDPEKRELVMSVLRSSIATAILMKIRLDAPSYQQQLIQKLPYSNKTIIQNLKLMVKASILQQDMQVVATKTRRRTWVKYYKPTNLGKWIILLFTSPKQVSPEQTRSIVKELFLLYASSIVEVCKKHQIDIEVFHEILSQEHSRELVRIAKPQKKPEVVVFGSIAMDTYGYAQSFPKMDETVYVEEIGRYPGGMGANVALALTKLGVPVAFVARLGNDQTGRQLLQNLKENNIDLSNLSISTQKSLETLIIHDSLENRWIFAVGSKDSAISIISPDEVHWSTILESRIVYIGEVFVELASLIANFAKTKNKTVNN